MVSRLRAGKDHRGTSWKDASGHTTHAAIECARDGGMGDSVETCTMVWVEMGQRSEEAEEKEPEDKRRG